MNRISTIAERVAGSHNIRELLRPYENLSLECDGMTRVVTYVLGKAGIRHRVMLGKISVEGKGEFAPHYWVELASGEVIDYKSRMWFGNDRSIPQGIFKPEGTVVSYSGRPVSVPVNDMVFRILTSSIAERVATRPIRVDRRVAQEAVARLVDNLKRGYFARNPDVPLGGSYAFTDHVIVQDVDGNDIDVQVQYKSLPSSDPDLVLGGGSGKTTKTQKPAVIVSINGNYTADVFTTTTSGERFADEVLSVLMHEITHQADVYTKSVLPKSQRVLTVKELDLQKYYNSPGEVHSYMREVFEEVYRHLPVFLQHFKVNEAVSRLVKLSPTWQRISEHMTDRNKDIVLKGVYQAVQDYIVEQGLQKAASEIVKVAKELVE